MTRILLVTHYYPEHRGGIEIAAGELARRLARRGLQVRWAASDVTPGAGPGDVGRLPMAAWNIAERRLGFPYPIWGPLSSWRLLREVARADVVHLHDCLYFGNVMAFLAARLLGKRVLVTQHIADIPYDNPLLRALLAVGNRTLGRLMLGGADHCVCISSGVLEDLTGRVRFRRPPRYRPNGVDAEIFHPVPVETRRALRDRLGWPTDRAVMLFVGRLVDKKGLRLLRELARATPELAWVFVGWGPNDPSRWELANVRCLGARPQSELSDLYRAADLLVLPAVGEGFPLVVQEAMACGLPAMITRETARGCPDVDTVLPTADLDPYAWLTTLRELAAAPERLRALRPRVAAFAQRWDWERCADDYAELIRTMTADTRPGGPGGIRSRAVDHRPG